MIKGGNIVTESGHYGEQGMKENVVYYLDTKAPKECGQVSCLSCQFEICRRHENKKSKAFER